MSKKRVLFFGESCLLSSGYATYAYNLLRYLASTNKYILTEGPATYSDGTNPRIRELHWEHIPNIPSDPDKLAVYHSQPSYQFGEYAFDDVCLRVRPDIVLSIRDEWADDYLQVSPAKPYYKHIYMPTVDSQPQKIEWLQTFANVDKILTYSDWGFDVLKKEGCGNLPLVKSAMMGVDTNIFKPLDQQWCRNALKVPLNGFIIGTIMRNQIRKLYPALYKAFAKFLEVAPAPIAAKTWLYIHARHPDIGWNLPELAREFGVGHRVLYTYWCKECGAIEASLYRGTLAECTSCNQFEAEMPGMQNGIDTKSLASLINTFDCYVQYANCEGFGAPQLEAAACKVPVFATDYSAMSDVVRKLNGFPIKVRSMDRTFHEQADRAIPDEDDFVQQLVSYATLPKEIRLKHENAALAGVNQHFTWNKVGKVWEDTIDETEPHNKWDSPPQIKTGDMVIPEDLENHEFIRYGFEQLSGMPQLSNTHRANMFLRFLNNGRTDEGQPFDRNEMLKQFFVLRERKNTFERKRCGLA